MFIGKSQAQISQDMADILTSADQQPDADVSNGSVNRDIIDVTAIQLADAYTQLENARVNASLQNAAQISIDSLSQIALNFDVLQTQATNATGEVVFQAIAQPSRRIDIPIDTILRTSPIAGEEMVEYRTTENAIMDASAAYNPLTGYYEVTVPVKALYAGTAYNVGMESITVMPNRIVGVDFVANPDPINNAADADSNTAVANGILAKTKDNALGTASGIKGAILVAFPDLLGVEIVTPFDADNGRVQFGNEVDVPIITPSSSTFQETLAALGSGKTRLDLGRPATTISSVVNKNTLSPYSPSTDYTFVQDQSVVYGYSNRSFDSLSWFPGKEPTLGTELVITGVYSPWVSEVQGYLNDPTRHAVTTDLRVKNAQQVNIDVSMTVTAISGTDRVELSNILRTAIINSLNTYVLGFDVLEDDIIRLVDSFSQVYFVSTPLDVVKKSSSFYPLINQSISIRKQEFARPGTITVVVI